MLLSKNGTIEASSWRRLTQKLASLLNTFSRPLNIERKLKQFLPKLRWERERLITDKSPDQILRRLRREFTTLTRRWRHRTHSERKKTVIFNDSVVQISLRLIWWEIQISKLHCVKIRREMKMIWSKRDYGDWFWKSRWFVKGMERTERV